MKNWFKNRMRNFAYQRMLNKDDLYGSEHELRMYVIVRDDILPPLNQGIQALHAVVEYGFAVAANENLWQDAEVFEQWGTNHKTVILLGVDVLTAQRIMKRAEKRGVSYSEFREPDLDNCCTAVAFRPMTRNQSKDIMFGLRPAQ